jgi:acyl-CoA hydrolase
MPPLNWSEKSSSVPMATYIAVYACSPHDANGEGPFFGGNMLMTLAVVLIVLWLLGMVSAYTMGGLIHVLLVVAIVVVLVRVIQGRKVL